MFGFTRRAAAVGAAALLLTTTSAFADDYCVPFASGVPAQPGPPTWWTAADAATAFDDPRWNGAIGVGEHGVFSGRDVTGATRVAYGQEAGVTYVYLTSGAILDPEGTSLLAADKDRVVVALADGTHAYGVTVAVDTTSASSFAPVAVTVNALNPAQSEVPVVPTPAWASGLTSGTLGSASRVRAWVECPLNSAGTSPDCSLGRIWGVAVRIPIGAANDSNLALALPIATTFKLWYSAIAEYATPFADRAVFSWPHAPSIASTVAPDITSIADATKWSPMRIGGTGPCASGISLVSSDIGTSNPMDWLITASPTFHARPTNATTAGIVGNAIHARLRIADWGSSIGDSPDWTDVCQAVSASATSVAAGARFELTCSKTFDPCDYQKGLTTELPGCPSGSIATATHYHHQCVLGELAVGPGAPNVPLVFTPVSAFRNMEFATASAVDRDAVVSVRGAGSIPGVPERRLYLYVETLHMPRPGDVKDHQTPSASWDRELLAQVRAGRASDERIAAVMPTYLVHVYRQERETLPGGGSRDLYVEQPSFGLFVSHDGPLDGWKHDLTGPNVTRVSDHFYHLGIANDSAAVVRVHIETCVGDACTTPTGGGPTAPGPTCRHGTLVCFLLRYWWVWLIALVVIVVGVLVDRSRP